MRRTARPAVESLEGKALLSPVSGLVPDLSSKVTADRMSYRSGHSIQLTFTETNVSNHDVTVDLGPSNDGFTASRAGQSVWGSNAGVEPDFLEVDVLHPHQSLTLHATWDGRSDMMDPADPMSEGPQLTGTFQIHNELDPDGPPATISIGVPRTTPQVPHARIR